MRQFQVVQVIEQVLNLGKLILERSLLVPLSVNPPSVIFQASCPICRTLHLICFFCCISYIEHRRRWFSFLLDSQLCLRSFPAEKLSMQLVMLLNVSLGFRWSRRLLFAGDDPSSSSSSFTNLSDPSLMPMILKKNSAAAVSSMRHCRSLFGGRPANSAPPPD